MSQTWTIMIKDDPLRVVPDAFGYKPGEALRAQLGDLVSWNNQTSVDREIEVPFGNPVKIQVAAFKSSSPGYVIQEQDVHLGTINYLIDNQVKGKITVVES